jgi:hypothetical protein
MTGLMMAVATLLFHKFYLKSLPRALKEKEKENELSYQSRPDSMRREVSR